MEMAGNENKLPQEGRTDGPESLSKQVLGSSTDSGGSNEPLYKTNKTDGNKTKMCEWSNILNPFERRSSIDRSPPRSRINSAPGAVNPGPIDPSSVYSETEKSKRKRDENSEPSKTTKREKSEMQCTLDRLMSKMEELVQQIKTNVNTKGEIKKGITEAYKLGSTLKRLARRQESIDIEVQCDMPENPEILSNNGQKTDVAVQTMTQREKDNEADILRKEIDQVYSFQHYYKLPNSPWPETVYHKTKLVLGNPLKRNEGNIAIFGEENKEGKMGALENALVNKYPDLLETDIEATESGKMILLEQTTKLKNNEGDTRTKTRNIARVLININEDKTESRRSCYTLLSQLKDIIKEQNGSMLILAHANRDQTNELRKMAECIFKDDDINVEVYAPKAKSRPYSEVAKSRNKPEKISSGGKSQQSRRPKTQTLWIKDEKRTYTELLKNVKEEILKTGAADKINSVRKTNSGELLLVLKEGADDIKKTVESNLSGAKIRMGKTTTTLNIKDLDAVTTKEEVLKELKKTTGREDIKVKSIRPAYGESQIATIEINKESAKKLITMGKVRIGMTRCRVRERVELTKCFKCWEYGHIAPNCKSTINREKCCFKCNKEGHASKDCKENPFCPLCHKEGHQVGSSTCEALKTAIDARKRK